MLEPELPGGNARASLVSYRDLPNLVDKAIKSASARLDAGALLPGPIVKKWEIVGKVAKDLATAEHFSKEVTAHLGSGVHAEPAILQIGGRIICGFIERPNIAVERQF
jgi:hypothetical protein